MGRNSRIEVRLTDDEKRAVEEAAERESRTVSAWVRLAVKKCLDEGAFGRKD